MPPDELNKTKKEVRSETTGRPERMFEYNGVSYTSRELFNMQKCKVSLTILRNRLRKDWDIEDAMTRLVRWGSKKS